MCSGSDRLRNFRSVCSVLLCARLADNVSDQTRVARNVRSDHDRGCAHLRMLSQDRFDLSQLDAEAATFTR